MAEICIGCGLTVDPLTGRLVSNVATWPAGYDITNDAGEVYCDPTTGRLKTLQDVTETGLTSFYPADTAVPVGFPIVTKSGRWAGTAAEEPGGSTSCSPPRSSTAFSPCR